MNYTFRDPDKLTMTYTGLLQGKKGKVRFQEKEKPMDQLATRREIQILQNFFYICAKSQNCGLNVVL